MKFFKKIDIVIISILLVISVGGYFAYRAIFSQKQAVAEIYYETNLIKTIDLSKGEDYYYIPQENQNVKIHVCSNGSIEFVEANCPDKLCIKSGNLSIIGESATCLPNKIMIKIVAKDKNDNDDIDITIGGQ